MAYGEEQRRAVTERTRTSETSGVRCLLPRCDLVRRRIGDSRHERLDARSRQLSGEQGEVSARHEESFRRRGCRRLEIRIVGGSGERGWGGGGIGGGSMGLGGQVRRE